MTGIGSLREPRLPTRILVVDDDDDAAWGLASILRAEFGCEVRTATDGAHAVDEASDMRPEVILMDISMPGIDGVEAAQVLRRLFAADAMPRLIAISGLAGDHDRSRILAAGFDAYLQKPVPIACLLALLRGA